MTNNEPKADILVIDDTPENLSLLSNMLTERGYKVRSVTKGSTGLRGAQAAPPDLILLDVNMPQMNGYEVCEKLKAQQPTKDIPVIFISALGDTIDKVKAFQVGGVDYITKPFQVEEVLARIDTHLTVCRLQQQLQQQNTQLQKEISDRTAAEEKFTKAFRSSPHPIAIATLSGGRFLEVNNSFLRITGYEQQEVFERTAAELNLWFPAETYLKAIHKLLQDGSLYNQEVQIRSRTGETKVVLLSVELIELAGVQCTLNIINDITERKRLENEFISLVSHELRTPMSSIIGALDLLGTGQLGNLNTQGKQVLNIAITNTERLMRLVNDILDLERIKSGKIQMQKVRCNGANLLAQASETMQTLANNSQLRLEVETSSVILWGDPDRILQTLTNLLSNAIKFSEPGQTIWLRSRLYGDYLQVEVQDEGRGIPADKLQLIFERFQQVDASDSRSKGGTGLGLSICRNIIEQHNGKIWAESILGQGSTFYFTLPLVSG
ncbi:MAG: ATP-binding protein [Spirulinaceae cyanobacterium]